LPDQAEPLQRAQLLAALSVGSEIIGLRQMAAHLGTAAELDAALNASRSETARSRSRGCVNSTTDSPATRETGTEATMALRGRAAHPGHLRGACRAWRLLRRRSARMRFTEIDLFGVYVAPISLMMVEAWLVTIVLRRVADRWGLLRYVWHPALFVFAVYIIVLSSWILIIRVSSS
jgi:hypothetical protein